MQITKQPAVYLMASALRGTLYAGVTSDLVRRDYEHKHGMFGGFTKKHGCKLLVWYELHENMESAILREKQLKIWLAPQENPIDRERKSILA